MLNGSKKVTTRFELENIKKLLPPKNQSQVAFRYESKETHLTAGMDNIFTAYNTQSHVE